MYNLKQGVRKTRFWYREDSLRCCIVRYATMGFIGSLRYSITLQSLARRVADELEHRRRSLTPYPVGTPLAHICYKANTRVTSCQSQVWTQSAILGVHIPSLTSGHRTARSSTIDIVALHGSVSRKRAIDNDRWWRSIPSSG